MLYYLYTVCKKLLRTPLGNWGKNQSLENGIQNTLELCPVTKVSGGLIDVWHMNIAPSELYCLVSQSIKKIHNQIFIRGFYVYKY